MIASGPRATEMLLCREVTRRAMSRHLLLVRNPRNLSLVLASMPGGQQFLCGRTLADGVRQPRNGLHRRRKCGLPRRITEPEKYWTGVHSPRSSTSRLNSSKPQLPSRRENRSTHLLCSKFSILMKTNHDLSMRFDIELFSTRFLRSRQHTPILQRFSKLDDRWGRGNFRYYPER
jgi:hypothetical protein